MQKDSLKNTKNEILKKVYITYQKGKKKNEKHNKYKPSNKMTTLSSNIKIIT